MGDNRPRLDPETRCYGGVCCYCARSHADQSCCSHDACAVRSPVGVFCEKRYDHPGEHEGCGVRWTAPDPDLYIMPDFEVHEPESVEARGRVVGVGPADAREALSEITVVEFKK